MSDRTVSFFTIVARNYLAYAYVLGNSVKQYHPDCDFFIFLMDDINHEYEQEIKNKGFLTIFPENIDIKNYKHFVFKYNIVEASTGVKPFVMQYLLKQGFNKVLYLDPDILCYRSLHEAIDALDNYFIVITPHRLSPIPENFFPPDRAFLSYGAYNLGFIGVSSGLIADSFLNWWSNHLADRCLSVKQLNLFVDQKWIDLVPSYFDGVYILKSLSYNTAYWNFHERTLIKKDKTYYVQESGDPIAFIHYSGLDINNWKKISKSLSFIPFFDKDYHAVNGLSLENRADFREPFEDYVKLLIANEYKRYASIPYAFSTYSNGDTISKLERTLFLRSVKWPNKITDPFQVGQGSFWQFCRHLGIKLKHNSSYHATPNPNIKQKYGIVFMLIQYMIQAMIRIFGVENYLRFTDYVTQQFLLINHNFLLSEDNLEDKK